MKCRYCKHEMKRGPGTTNLCLNPNDYYCPHCYAECHMLFDTWKQWVKGYIDYGWE